MADNILLNAGSGGDTLAADDDGTAKHQYVKIEFGADNTQTPVDASNPLPVDLRTDNLTGNLDVNIAADAAGLATAANQLADGHNVTVDNAAGGSAVNIQDGGNSITTDITTTPSVEDANNTTTTPLGVDAVFTGTGVETLNYKTITIVIFADQNSATDGVSLQWSPDNTNWNHTALYTYTANTDFSIGASVRARYFRLVYTNGGTGQGVFRCYTFLHPTAASHNIRPLEYTLTGQESAEVTRAVISADDGTTYQNIGATTGGNLKISVQEVSDGLDVGAGNAGAETQRVSISTDDVNLSAIKTAVEVIDNAIAGSEMQVDIVADGAGLATAANQLPDGHNVTVDNASLVVDLTTNNDVQGAVAEAAAPSGNPFLIAGDDGSVVRNVAVDASGNVQVDIVADAAGLATAANQLPDGHNVTIDNAAGASAVNIQDGGNDISVDWAGTAPPIGAGTEAAALRVTLATDSTGVVSVDDNGANLSIDFNGTNPTLNTGAVDGGTLRVTVATDDTVTVDNGGTFATQATLQTGSALVGDVGLSGARTSGGTTLYKNIDVDETEDQVKGTAGQVYWIHAMNLASGVRYLKFYNATAASVTVGTTTPDLTFPLATQGDTNGAGFTLSIPNGIAFGTAITIAATTGIADNDSGAPGANEVVVMLGYA